MTWGEINAALLIGASAGSCPFLLYTTFQGWRAHKRVMKAEREYREALERATAHLNANPQAWLDAMAAMDDKRRQH